MYATLGSISKIANEMSLNLSRATVTKTLKNFAPIIIGLLLFSAGVFALNRLLSHVNFNDVLKSAHMTPYTHLFYALVATALGYVALIGYDWSALRYLGCKIPFRIVAVGGFLGYSFGNTIGISAVSGGAVRYRIYSAFGLNAFEVAAVSTFVALAFGMGITVIGLSALAIHPNALAGVLPWSVATTRFYAETSVAAILALMIWLSITGKSFSIKGFVISAPSIGILSGQLIITLADTAMAALTLYILLPAGSPDFITFLAVFSAAVMIGVLSHVPGGVGVFESVIIATMPTTAPIEQVAAALLLYRVIYYFVPFAIAMIVVALNEARLASGFIGRHLGEAPEVMQPIVKAINAITPTVTGASGLGLGIYLLLMALIPAVRPDNIDPHDLLAAVLLEGGTMLSAVLGVVLIILAQGLYRRISGAFWLTEAALCGGALASVLNGLDFGSAGLLLVAATVLWPLRGEFYRSAQLTQNLLSLRWLVLVISLVIGVGSFLFFFHEIIPYSTDLLLEFSKNSGTPRALRAALAASTLVMFFLIYLALLPARAHNRIADDTALAQARKIIKGQDDPDAWLALSGDKALFMSDAEDAFIMYAVQGRSWVAFGDPVGPKEAISDLVWAFFDAAYYANARPVFYEVSEVYLPLWIELGLAVHKVGEEAVIDLQGWSLAGGKFKKMRAAHNKAMSDGWCFEMHNAPHTGAFLEQLRLVSDAWMGEKPTREKGFSVGKFSENYLANFPIAVVRHKGRILAFANILLASDGQRVSIDLMRYLPDKASGMMEFLFIELAGHYRKAGAIEFSLGMAPLSGLSGRRGTRVWNRFGAILYRHGGAYYNFSGLRAFKQKFQPQWQPRFLAISTNVSPFVALKDVAILIAGSARGLISK